MTDQNQLSEELQGRIAAALAAQAEISDGQADEIAFHMSDWLPDLIELHRALVVNGATDPEETYNAVLGFLLHAPEHIAEAAEQLTGLPLEGVFKEGP
jgi:hypothetical protein